MTVPAVINPDEPVRITITVQRATNPTGVQRVFVDGNIDMLIQKSERIDLCHRVLPNVLDQLADRLLHNVTAAPMPQSVELNGKI